MAKLDLLEDGIKLLLVGLVRKAHKKTSSVVTVDGEANGTTVIESIKHTAVSQVGGEPTLLEHLAREGGKDKMEGVVEEHGVYL